jgi:PleD family two-component response regulator
MRQERPRILCISESSSQLKEICSAVFSLGYEAISASSPERALACCIGTDVVAVVLGTESLTEMGYSAAQSIRMARPDLPILLLEQGHDEIVPHGVSAVAASVSMMTQKLVALL